MWVPEFEEAFDVMDSERGDMETPYADSESDNTVTDSSYIYKMKKPPPWLDDFNDYFVKYKTENDGGYIEQFLHYYEGILNSKVRRFMMNYHLEPHRRDDLKQIFCDVMLEQLPAYSPDDEVVFLQQIKYIVQGEWRNYVRTCCNAAYVDKVGTYDNIRKVARLYYENESIVPYDKLVTEIAEKVHLTARTVDSFIKDTLSARYADDIDGAEMHELAAPESAEDYTRDEITQALTILNSIELRIIELYAGVDTKTFEEIQPLTYDRIAMMVGYDSESTIEKKLKEIRAKVKEKLIFIHNEE